MNKQKLTKILMSLLLGGTLLMSGMTAQAQTVSLDLAQSIDLAMQNNHLVKQSEYNAEAANWAFKGAKAQTGLSLNWQGSGARGTGTYFDMQQRNRDFANVFTANIPLYTGGKLENNIKIQRLGKDIGDLSLTTTRQDVQYQVTDAYYQILQARQYVGVSKEAVDQLEQHLRVVNARYSAGTVAKSDVLRSEVELANAKQRLVTAKNNYELAKTAMLNMLALPTDTDLEVKGSLEHKAYDITLAKAIEMAMTNRSDYKAAAKSVEQAEAATKLAHSGALPTIAAYASYTMDSSKPFKNDLMDKKEVGVQANWQIFDNNVTRSQVKQAEANVQKANEAEKNLKEGIVLQLKQALLSMRTAEQNIGTTQVAVGRASEDYNISQVRYSAGVGTNLDVIDARVALTVAQTNHLVALYEYNVSKAKLQRAMGLTTLSDVVSTATAK